MRDGEAAFAAFLLCVAVLCWAGNFVLGRAVHEEIPPVTLAFWRWAVAGSVLLPFAGLLAWRHRALIRRDWRLLALLAIFGIVAFHICVYSGLRTTTATNGAIIQAAVPVVMPAFSWMILGEGITMRQGIGIAVSLGGVAIIVLKGAPQTIVALQFTPGDLWMLAAVPIWATYSVLLRRLPADLPRLVMLIGIIAIGLALLAPLYALEVAYRGGFPPSVANLLALAYFGLFAGVVAYVCWNRGVLTVGPNVAGLFLHLMPVFATTLAVLLLGERPQPYHIPGIVLIATGIVLTTTGRPRPAAPAR